MADIEVGICVTSFGDAIEGDIIDIRPAKNVIGRSMHERAHMLWFVADTSEMPPSDALVDTGQLFRLRYNLPLAALVQVASNLNLARCRDANDIYQPEIDLDVRTGAIRRHVKLTGLRASIVDKRTL